MRVLVSGSSGTIGHHLLPFLNSKGFEVFRLIRNKKKLEDNSLYWNPKESEIDQEGLAKISPEVVIHLAGASIASPWTKKNREAVLQSRVQGTSLLASALTQLETPPKVLLSASAVGYYGDTQDQVTDESGNVGAGFAAEVCQRWETETKPAEEKMRVVHMRIGIVLTRQGGALSQMLLPFSLGLGGVIGSGKQYMSWVAIDDILGSIEHLIREESLSGPVNLVSPNPATNYDFTKTLGKALRRPTIFPVPAFALKIGLGDMAKELLLSGQRAVPKKLMDSGYQFQHENLLDALKATV